MLADTNRRACGVASFLLLFLSAAAVHAQSIDVGDAAGSAGRTVQVPVFWSEDGSEGSGLSIDIRGLDLPFDPNETNRPDCQFSPAVLAVKENSAVAFRPPGCAVGETCVSIRIGIISFDPGNNPLPVPSGEIVRCSFTIPPEALVGGEFDFVVDRASYILPSGSEFDITGNSSGGTVHVVAAPESFKCYKAGDLKEPKFVSTTVALADQFGVNDGAFEVKKPFLLCNPTDVNGAGIANPVDHLTCYKAKGPKLARADRPRVQIDDALGSSQLEIVKPFLLCVPSAKTILP